MANKSRQAKTRGGRRLESDESDDITSVPDVSTVLSRCVKTYDSAMDVARTTLLLGLVSTKAWLISDCGRDECIRTTAND